MKQRVTAYREMRDERHDELCDLGCKHEVRVYQTKTLYPTNETHIHDNGYSKHEMPVYVDAQGRKYKARISFDFHASTYYTRDDLEGRDYFQSRPTYPARDTLGKLLENPYPPRLTK